MAEADERAAAHLLDRAAFALAAAVLAVKPLYVDDPGRVAPALVTLLVASAAVILWLAGQVTGRRPVLRRAGALLPLGLMAAAVVLGLFTAEHRRPALAAAAEWLGTLLAVLCLVQTLRGRADVRTLLGILLATGAVVALYGIHQYFIGLDELRAAYRRDPAAVLAQVGGIEYGTWMQKRFEKRLADQAAFGTFALSNSLAGYCLMLAPAALGLLLDRARGGLWRPPACAAEAGRRPREPSPSQGEGRVRVGRPPSRVAAPLRPPRTRRVSPTGRGVRHTRGRVCHIQWGLVASAAVLAVLVLALVLTKSKGGYAAGGLAFAAFAVGAVWHRLLATGGTLRRRARVVVPAALVAAALVAAAAAWRVRAAGVEGAFGPSMRFRVDYWTGALRVIARHPLRGVGLAAFGDYYPRYKNPESPEDVRHPHNLVLDLWTAMGPLGVAAFAWLLAAGLWPGRRRAGQGTPGPAAPRRHSAAEFARRVFFAARSRRRGQKGDAPQGAPSTRRRVEGELNRRAGAGGTAALPSHPLVPVFAALPVWLTVYGLGLQGGMFCAAGAAVWMAVALAVSWSDGRSARPPGEDDEPHALVRAGVVAGAVGFVAHALIDLDVSVPALVATVLALVVVAERLRGGGSGTAILAVRHGLEARATSPPSAAKGVRQRTGVPRSVWLAAGLLAAAGAGTLALAYGVVQPLLAGETDYLAGRAAQQESAKAAREGDHAAAAAALRRAMALYRESLERDPLNGDAHLALARLAFDAWDAPPGVSLGPQERQAQFEAGMAHLQAARRLHPRRAQSCQMEAEVYERAARRAASVLDRREALLKARAAADCLVDELGPADVRHRLLRARILEALDDRAGAARDYRAALDLDALQRDPLLRLPEAERRRIEAALRRLETR